MNGSSIIQGLTLQLRNDDLEGYGGILIRGIYDINFGDSFIGPQVCAMKLFSGTNAFSKSFTTRIIGYEFPKEYIRKAERVGLGDNAKRSGTDKLKYRFLIKPNH